MKKTNHVVRVVLGACLGQEALLASDVHAPDKSVSEQGLYSPRTHAGLLIDGDEFFQDMQAKWREGALAFIARTPPPVFERDTIPPFLTEHVSADGGQTTLTLESHFWEHPQYRTWYVIPNHMSAFKLCAQSEVVTTVSGLIRHKGYSDRGVYGYEVQIAFGKGIKKTITFSLYEPFKR